MKTLKSNISEAYKVKVDCSKDSESDSYDKMIWKRKWMTWLGWQGNARKTETSIKFGTVPDSYLGTWMYCSEYFNVFEYLVWASHEIKTVGGILAKPASEKGKNYLYWNTSSGNKRLWRWQFQ